MTMREHVADLAYRLAREAEAVCRHYLSNGRRSGNYWLVGDVRNTSGRSMFVRLTGDVSGKRAAGKWIDAATGEHGDLLDVIRESCGLVDFHDVTEEARRFLKISHREVAPGRRPKSFVRTGRFAEIGASAVCHVEADLRHDRGILSAHARHHGFGRSRQSSVSSALLLSSGSTHANRDLASDDRSGDRFRW